MSGVMNEALSQVIALRSFKDSDYRFIENHWVLGLRGGSDWYKAIPEQMFVSTYRKVVNKLLTDPGTFVVIACIKDDPDAIVGFSVGRRLQGDAPTLHYVYVKSKWRMMGIAKALVPEDIIQFTHLTKMGRNIQRKHQNLIFNPFAL